MKTRDTFRGSPGRARSKSLYWWGVAGNVLCCLMFSALLIWCIFTTLNHLS